MKKSKVKALAKLAEMLPISYELQKEYEVVNIYDLTKEEIQHINFDISGIDDKVKRAKIKVVLINHKNRIQKAFSKRKEAGISDYILWVDANNKRLNELSEKLKLNRVDSELMEISKSKTGFWSLLIKFLFGFYHIFVKNDTKYKAA